MAKRNKKTTINYFQLRPKNSTFSKHGLRLLLENKLLSVEYIGLKTSDKVFKIKDSPEYRNGCFIGAIYNIQMYNIPPSFNVVTNAVGGLILDNDDGLGIPTCFLIDPYANILVIESGTGVSHTALCNYLSYSLGLPSIEAALLLNPSQIEQFYKMKTVFSFEVKVANINSASYLDTNSMSTRQILHAADGTNTDSLTYKIEIDPSNRSSGKSLNNGFLINAVQGLLTYGETKKDVQTIKIKGTVDDEESITVLDLINDRLNDTIEYSVEERIIKSYNLEQRYQQIEEKYLKRRDEILKVYSFGEKD